MPKRTTLAQPSPRQPHSETVQPSLFGLDAQPCLLIEPAILHVRLPDFAAVVASHAHPDPGEQALIVGSVADGRGVVLAASPAARTEGVTQGMALREAEKLCPDAEIVMGLAATALPFAESAADELRRWIRILSAYGEAGRALRRIGLTDTAIEPPVPAGGVGTGGLVAHAEVVARVRTLAASIAADRAAATISTVDLLLAVMLAYGDAFDHELRAHGSSATELIDCLGSSPDPAPVS